MTKTELNEKITFSPIGQTRTLDVCAIKLDGKEIGCERTRHYWNRPLVVEYWMNAEVYTSESEAIHAKEEHGGCAAIEEPYSEGHWFIAFDDLGKAVDYYEKCLSN